MLPEVSWAGFWLPGGSSTGFWSPGGSWRLLGCIVVSWGFLCWIQRVPGASWAGFCQELICFEKGFITVFSDVIIVMTIVVIVTIMIIINTIIKVKVVNMLIINICNINVVYGCNMNNVKNNICVEVRMAGPSLEARKELQT